MATAKKKTNKPLSKSAVLQAVTDSVGEELTRKQVKQVVEALAEIGHRELKKNGIFVLHGFAKFVVVKKPARPAREGINPFTKEKQKFAAKPASKGVRARPSRRSKTRSSREPSLGASPAWMGRRATCASSRWSGEDRSAAR